MKIPVKPVLPLAHLNLPAGFMAPGFPITMKLMTTDFG